MLKLTFYDNLALDSYQYYNYITLFLMSIICILALAFSMKKSTVSCLTISEGSAVRRTVSAVSEFINKHYLIFLGLIFLIFLFTRIYMLGLIPTGIMVDEVVVE